MTQEEKQLLLIDLCARLPYRNTKVKVTKPTNDIMVGKHICSTIDIKDFILGKFIIRPYLRPMSSMTDEERENWYKQSKVDYDCEFNPEPILLLENCHLSVDWLNKYGFDYRGLIPKGLGLEASEGMYKVD